ncbi:MAG: tetratricopeptide repeat protein [bacterium]
MYYRVKYCLLIISILSCTLLPRPNIYRKGVENYQNKDYERAIKYFTDFYKKSPSGDSTLFYLYNCYIKTGNIDASIKILEELVRRKNPGEQIYFNLFNYYRQTNLYYKINQLLLNCPVSVLHRFDRSCALTQQLCAEIFTGATTNNKIKNPIAYAIKKGFLQPAPDGNFYANDTIKLNNFILLLDSFLPPKNPDRFFLMKNISSDSYLYVPYMRLVEFNIIDFDENINPEMTVLISQAVQSINSLKNKGFIK